MDYRLLTNDHLTSIRHQKLLDLEANHARLALDVELAQGAGATDQQVASTLRDMIFIEAQVHLLLQLLAPKAKPAPDVVDEPTPVEAEVVTAQARTNGGRARKAPVKVRTRASRS
jgi:hypothetical protein